jgi:hypothetical protein
MVTSVQFRLDILEFIVNINKLAVVAGHRSVETVVESGPTYTPEYLLTVLYD